MNEYTIELRAYQANGVIESNCNEIAFINLGTATATVNGVLPLTQNQSFSTSGNASEIDKTIYKVAFGSGTKNLLVTRKVYK